jgi:hypothetical protein
LARKTLFLTQQQGEPLQVLSLFLVSNLLGLFFLFFFQHTHSLRVRVVIILIGNNTQEESQVVLHWNDV